MTAKLRQDGFRDLPLTNRLRAHVVRASALAIAAKNRDTTRSKQTIENLLDGLDQAQLRDLVVVCAMFADTSALVGQSLQDPLEPVELAIRACARLFRVTEEQMRSTERKQEVTEARQVAAYVAHRLFGIPSTDVGRMFNRDHSTILYSCGRVGETPRLRRIALDIAQRVGWERADDETGSPNVIAS